MTQSELTNLRRLNSEKAERLDEYRMMLRDMKALIAAKDAEIRQQAEDLERLRETIDKLTKSRREVATRAESLESKCAKMRELLQDAHVHVVCSGKAGWGAVVKRIDAILESEE